MPRRDRRAVLEEGAGYWPGFVDIMAVLVLVLLFVLVTAFIQAAVSIQQRIAGKQAVQEIMDKRKELTTALETQLGAETVTVNSDGNISFKGDVLFKPDTAELRDTDSVKRLVVRLAKGIADVLEQPRFRDGLYAILVEGHTADDGKPAVSHWQLSEERALQIILALQAADERLQAPANARYLGAAAHANYRPVKMGDSEEAKSQNRRVEIRLVLRDEGLRDALLAALSQ